MPSVRFTRHLQRFFPDLPDVANVEATIVADVVRELEARFPGFASYIVDERGALRQHVNIFVGGEMIHDRAALSDAVSASAEIAILQALSGGLS